MQRLKTFFKRLSQKIAFYPSVIALLGGLLAAVLVYLESRGLSDQMLKVAPSLVIEDSVTARVILSTLIAG